MTTQIALTVRQRVQLIRKAVPHGNMLENLFKSQNSICDLCPHPIQDLICASLDHSTPVLFFARSDMPLGEAIAQANDPKNLRCVHASCNLAKGRRTREEWFAQGLNKREALRLLPDGELLLLAFKMGAGGRVGGPVQGRKNMENGHMQALGKSGVGGRIGGRKAKEQAKGIFAPGMQVKGGRIGGHKMKEQGKGIFAPGYDKGTGGQRSHKLHPEMAAQQGRIQGRQNVESGHIRALPHIRWHVRRGISNPNCELCRAA